MSPPLLALDGVVKHFVLRRSLLGVPYQRFLRDARVLLSPSSASHAAQRSRP